MHELTAATAASGWTYGGSILTFAFPMILFIAVAGTLYVLYTKPHLVPGHRYRMDGRPAVATPPAATPPAVAPVPPGQAGGPGGAGGPGEQSAAAAGPGQASGPSGVEGS